MIRLTSRILRAFVIAAALCPTPVGAQTIARSFADLRPLLKPGETVRVTDATGQEAEGQIIELSSSLVLQLPTGRRQLAEPDVSRIRRWSRSARVAARRGDWSGRRSRGGVPDSP